MAEKYGTVPPKFTKAWWEHYWTYYKWHTIITLFIVVCITSAVYQSVTKEKYDITLAYAGYNAFSEESIEEISDKLSPLCEDVDENGKKNLCFSNIRFFKDDADADYNMAAHTKLQISLASDETYIYILDEKLLVSFIGDDADSSPFDPIENWYDGTVNPETAFSRFGKAYGIPISECKMFEDISQNLENHYLLLRYYPRDDQKEQLKGYEAATKLAAQIIG